MPPHSPAQGSSKMIETDGEVEAEEDKEKEDTADHHKLLTLINRISDLPDTQMRYIQRTYMSQSSTNPRPLQNSVAELALTMPNPNMLNQQQPMSFPGSSGSSSNTNTNLRLENVDNFTIQNPFLSYPSSRNLILPFLQEYLARLQYLSIAELLECQVATSREQFDATDWAAFDSKVSTKKVKVEIGDEAEEDKGEEDKLDPQPATY